MTYERLAAKEAGQKTYLSNKPCRKGHPPYRYASNDRCLICSKQSQKKAPWPPERLAAKNSGLRHYERALVCIKGHENKWYVSNGTCVHCHREKLARLRVRHPELGKASDKRYSERHPDRKQANTRRWEKAHPEIVRVRNLIAQMKEKARKNGVGSSVKRAQLMALYASQNNQCAVCSASEHLEVDHIVALSRGGASDISNLQVLCLSCNRSKGAKDNDEWLSSRVK